MILKSSTQLAHKQFVKKKKTIQRTLGKNSSLIDNF
jgi:hypothetical protein